MDPYDHVKEVGWTLIFDDDVTDFSERVLESYLRRVGWSQHHMKQTSRYLYKYMSYYYVLSWNKMAFYFHC